MSKKKPYKDYDSKKKGNKNIGREKLYFSHILSKLKSIKYNQFLRTERIRLWFSNRYLKKQIEVYLFSMKMLIISWLSCFSLHLS